MSSIHIQYPHTLGKAAARNRIEGVAQQIKNRLGADYQWQGDSLRFDRSGVKGRIDVEEKDVVVDVDLGLMLGAFKGQIENQIKGYLHDTLK